MVHALRLRFLIAFSLVVTVIGCDSRPPIDPIVLANYELAAVRGDLEVFDRLVATGSTDIIVRQQVATSMLRHVILVRTANPQVDDLNGDSLEALCELTESDTRKILDFAPAKDLVLLAHDYLTSVETRVRELVTRYQNTSKGSRCQLRAAPPASSHTMKTPRFGVTSFDAGFARTLGGHLAEESVGFGAADRRLPLARQRTFPSAPHSCRTLKSARWSA